MSFRPRVAAVGFVTAAVLLVTACSGGNTIGPSPEVTDGRLAAFRDCDQLLVELKASALSALSAGRRLDDGTRDPLAAEDSGDRAAEAGAAEPGDAHSTTNVAEVGVDEPDLVKTDGERVVTVHDGELIVTDVATGEMSSLSLADAPVDFTGQVNLLLDGDRALLFSPKESYRFEGAGDSSEVTGLLLVDLSGEPTVVDDYTITGDLVDARDVDGRVSVVVRSHPELEPLPGIDDQREAAATAINESTLADWLPRYSSSGGEHGTVACDAVLRPAAYSADSMLTVLTFRPESGLDDGSPVSVEVDGDTVYGTSDALYVANDRQRYLTGRAGGGESRTEIHRFDLTGEAAAYLSSASVPGHLLNQYALSVWQGHLRVATTSQPRWEVTEDLAEMPPTTSGVYVLAADGDRLEQVGELTGLGAGESIFGVRFTGAVGYVVTFRQTDPLYVVDLTDPRKPTLAGELEMPGYSAYLHPLPDGRLLGVGQDGDAAGITGSALVSLFDVSDPADPRRTDKFTVPGGYAGTEFDAHAFLYWADPELVALPMSDPDGPNLLVLGLDGADFGADTRVVAEGDYGYPAPVSRALVAGGSLWMLTDRGLSRSDLSDAADTQWLPF